VGAIFPRPSWAFVKDASSEKQIKAAERAKKRHAKRIAAGCQAVIATKDGRFWLTQILIECGIDDGVSLEPALAQFELGKRAIGLSILAHVRSVQPDLLVQLIREHQADVGLQDVETEASLTASAAEGESD
jgi:hypothetical protein